MATMTCLLILTLLELKAHHGWCRKCVTQFDHCSNKTGQYLPCSSDGVGTPVIKRKKIAAHRRKGRQDVRTWLNSVQGIGLDITCNAIRGNHITGEIKTIDQEPSHQKLCCMTTNKSDVQPRILTLLVFLWLCKPSAQSVLAGCWVLPDPWLTHLLPKKSSIIYV